MNIHFHYDFQINFKFSNLFDIYFYYNRTQKNTQTNKKIFKFYENHITNYFKNNSIIKKAMNEHDYM